MRIALATVGTTGDIRPFATLARRLVERGHEVTAISWPVHRAALEAFQVEVRAYAANPAARLGSDHEHEIRIGNVATDINAIGVEPSGIEINRIAADSGSPKQPQRLSGAAVFRDIDVRDMSAQMGPVVDLSAERRLCDRHPTESSSTCTREHVKKTRDFT